MTPEERAALLQTASSRLGGKAELGRRLGYRDGAFVGQMIRGERPITEKTLAALSGIHALADLFSAGSASTAAPRAAAPTTLEQALEALGIALAPDMPDDVREDLADALAKLARRRGQVRDQQQVLQLLRPAANTGNRHAA